MKTPDWLYDMYRKQFPELTIDDVVALADSDWDLFEQDTKGELPWQ
jgi:hypothetical protein